MSEAYLCPVLSGPQLDDNGNPLSGGLIWTYDAGTTTPAATYTADDGLIQKSNPIVLSARGETSSIWLKAGKPYKLVLETAPASGQTHGAVLQTWDDVTGINDPAYLSGTPTWIEYADAPTRMSDTSFEVTGDARDTFQVARRLKCIVGASTLYARVVSASYGTGATTVTVEMDSGTLTSDLSAVRYAWIETAPVTCGLSSLANGLNNVSLVGSVLAFAGSSAPEGFLLCDGSAVSRTTYAALFAVIGSVYGSGDGYTTFNVPDLRGAFVRGLGAPGTADPDRVLGTLQMDALKDHTHTANHSHTASIVDHTHGYTDFTVTGDDPKYIGTGANYGSADTARTTSGATYASSPAVTVDSATVTTSSPSTGAATETRPINRALNYIIKY